MLAITLLAGVIGCGALVVELPATATSAALGLVLAAVALLSVRVVATAPLWLRGVVGLGTAALAAAVWLAAETEVGADRLNPIVGVAGVLGFGGALLASWVRRRSATAPGSAPARGSESAPAEGSAPAADSAPAPADGSAPAAAMRPDPEVRVPAPRQPGHGTHRSPRRQSRGAHAR